MYIDKNEQRRLQGKNRQFEERIDIFMKNAALLDKSLKWNGLGNLTLLTNDSSTLEESLSRINYHINAVDIPFSLNVPKGIRFYSAHFKIDAFNYFGSRPDDEYSILLDNDIVQLSNFPTFFYEVIESGIPTCYHLNIGSKYETALQDCRKAVPNLPLIQWTGGEYWGGINSFFSTLYNKVNIFADKYFCSLNDEQFHIGDEMLTTIALAQLKSEGIYYFDIGLTHIIKRYWGMHESKPLSSFDPVFAHLPADKVWISNLDLNTINSSTDFINKYQSHWKKFKLLNNIRNLFKCH